MRCLIQLERLNTYMEEHNDIHLAIRKVLEGQLSIEKIANNYVYP